jgi:phosphate transport system permease protein
MTRFTDRLFEIVAWLSACGVLTAVVALLAFLIWRGVGSLSPELFWGEAPWFQAMTGRVPVFEGIWPALAGTALLVVLSCSMAVPVGVASGITLAHYAPVRLRAWLGLAVDLLSGTPSIVMGLFGFTLILMLRRTVMPGARTCLLLSSFCVALLVLPYVIRTTQTALEAVPDSLRLAGAAMGLTRWQNIFHVLLPLSSRGILGGVLLAVGRASEDTAVILLTGVVAQAGIPHSLRDRFEALPFHIYYLAAEHQNRDQLDQAFGSCLVLLLVTGLLFLVAFVLQRTAERRWRTK